MTLSDRNQNTKPAAKEKISKKIAKNEALKNNAKPIKSVTATYIAILYYPFQKNEDNVAEVCYKSRERERESIYTHNYF